LKAEPAGKRPATRVAWTPVLTLTFTRLVVNTSSRMVYPFLAVFARGLGVDLAQISRVMTARSFTAALTPILAPLAERRGRKLGMLLGIGVFIIANLGVFLWPTFWVFFVGQCLSYLSLYILFSTSHAFLGDEIPYATRGRSIALLEISWSLSFITGVPLIGLLISRAGWKAPFPVFVLLGLLSFLFVTRWIPKSNPQQNKPVSLSQGFRQVINSPAALFGLIFSVLVHIGNESVNLVFGVWMENTFGLKIAALGLAAMVIGLSDLSGESFSALWVDRLGKKRAVGLGLLVNIISSLGLAWLGRSLWSALIFLFLFYLSFEFVIVSFVPVMTELLPSARTTLMSYDVAAHAIGRGLGDWLAPLLYALGFKFNAFSALIFSLLGLILLSRVRIPADQEKASPHAI
jgi:DHA1 family inner membrane transport protein